MVAAVAIFGGKDDSTTGGAAKTESTTEQKSTFAVNEPAIYNDTEITVTKVTKSAGSEWQKPKDGMEYVIVTVQIKNIGQKNNITYNPFDFKMQNSQGQIVDEAFTIIDADTSLSSGELALQYTGNLWSSSSKLTFNLQ